MTADLHFLNAHLFSGPFVQRVWSQHSLHHHLYSVHCDLQYPHILSGPCAPGECRYSTFFTRLAFFCFLQMTNTIYICMYSCIRIYIKKQTMHKCCGPLHVTVVHVFHPSWLHIALVQSTQNAPLLRTPS